MLLTWVALLVPRRLLWATIASVLVPWAIGAGVKHLSPPRLGGSLDNGLLLVDFVVIGSIVFLLSMVLTWAIGCWICAVMRGPRRDADSYPGGTPQ